MENEERKEGGSAVRKEAMKLDLRCPLRSMTVLEMGVTWDRAQTWALPLTCCGSLGWLFNLSEPPLGPL